MPKIERYIKVYAWLLRHSELNVSEAVLLSVLTWFPDGCWISSRKLSEMLGTNHRTIQRKIKRLQKKGWAAILPNMCNNRRYVWATLKEPPDGPLFEYCQKAEIEMNKLKAKNLVKQAAKQMSFW